MQKWWIYQSNQLKVYSVGAEWRGPRRCWGIEAGREVILDLPEVCYPWKVLAAIQASFPCSHPSSSLTGESGSKNSCQKGFNVIDKPFVSTKAPPLASPNKTAQNLRIGGKTCWAACGIKQQEVSVSVTVSQFLQMTVQSMQEIPGGTRSCSPDPFPSPCSRLPPPAARAAPLPFTTQFWQSWLFPAFPLFFSLSLHLERYFAFFFQAVAL